MKVIVMAGGGGTRLWPVSTPGRPKPFLPLLDGESLFERTIRRVLDGGTLELQASDVTVVTDRRYSGLVRLQAPGVRVVEEPVGRNTAAAIALGTLTCGAADDEVIAVLPADHTIEREDIFRGVLAAAARGIALGAFGVDSPLVTIGIRPDRPATEYGYLLPRLDAGADIEGLQAYPLEAFQEKPSPERASELVARPGVAWNAGMFLWRRRAIRDALAAFAPDVKDAVEAGLANGHLDEVYPTVRSVSIDYAVMEPAAAAGRVVMGSMDAGWSDVGSWGALLAAIGGRGDGRVVQAGETASATHADLVVRRVDGRLTAAAGPVDGILDPLGPSALLLGAAAERDLVDALLRRVSAAEAD